jgi:hypothetical protein
MPSDLPESMRRDPVGDWRIQDVEVLCREYGLTFRFGKGTSHTHMRHPAARENPDHPGASAYQAGLHAEARALY